ncbi:MAG: hypothetical protein R3F05_13465 [Planctomycetota bacterium]|nr:hypothetical protein [Planctomycetota bacterium]MCB9824422.1 hypothetical protein [Planctomycetota bacterium]MCB9900419.1 hypothetical protein [Planctomycetota bacterium]
MPIASLFRTLVGASLALSLVGCQGSTARLPAGGSVQPTVAGRAPVAWADAATARDAFTRQAPDGTVTATLQDASWLRFEGPPEEVEERYRAYFLEGYTTFDVILVTEEFGKPTDETFLLEDSAGRRAVSRPFRYDGQMGSGRGGFASHFELSFQHAITQDTRWVRLTRQSTGTSVEWRF